MTDLNTARQLGARFGYLNGNYKSDLYQSINAKANELSLGFTYVNTKYYNVQVIGKKRPYQKMGRTSYYAEFINYHAIKDLSEPDSNGDLNNEDIPTKAVSGYRIGLEGQVGGRIGLSYHFGFEKPLRAGKNFDVFFGFGMFLSFL